MDKAARLASFRVLLSSEALSAAVRAFQSSPSAQAIAANAAWLLLDRFGRLALSLVVGVWTARYLGPGQFGELYYVFAYLAFFQAVVGLGFDGIVVRDLATNASRDGEILGTACALRFMAGAACWALAVGGMAVWYGLGSRELLLCALAGGSMIFQSADTIDLWFQSKSQSKRTIIPKFVAVLVSNSVKIALLVSAAPLYAFALVVTIEALVGSLGLCFSYRLLPTAHAWRIGFRMAIRLLSESYPYLASGLAVTVYMRIDQIMIKAFLGYEASGLFAAALPFSTISYAIPAILCVSLAPVVARKKHEGTAAYKELLLLIFRAFGLMSILICLVTALAAPLLIGIVYGHRFAGAAPVLAIHVFCSFFVFQGMAQSLWMVNERRGHWALGQTLFGAAVAIGANVLLLPTLGVTGAAISAVLSQAASAVFSNLLISREILAMQFGIRPVAWGIKEL
ncbi:MAG: flippase [Roseiarcus sp.]|jgi:O-antigen/teichoic acid export membrane protein